ncbi:hypothetical protein NQ317_006976, partial [Molorchus minor]
MQCIEVIPVTHPRACGSSLYMEYWDALILKFVKNRVHSFFELVKLAEDKLDKGGVNFRRLTLYNSTRSSTMGYFSQFFFKNREVEIKGNSSPFPRVKPFYPRRYADRDIFGGLGNIFMPSAA